MEEELGSLQASLKPARTTQGGILGREKGTLPNYTAGRSPLIPVGNVAGPFKLWLWGQEGPDISETLMVPRL